MNKEIITTDNMDSIVRILTEAAVRGNMTAKLVHAVNQKINDLKVGKSLSKADKEELMLLWDNLIVAFANDAAPVGNVVYKFMKDNKEEYSSDSLCHVLIDSADLVEAINAGKSDNKEEFDLDELAEALKGLTSEDISDCVDKFIEQLKKSKCTSEDKPCACDDCECGRSNDLNHCDTPDTDEDFVDSDEAAINKIMELLEEEEKDCRKNNSKVIIVKTGGRPSAYDEFNSIFDTMLRRFFN